MNEHNELNEETSGSVEDLLYLRNLPSEFHRRCVEASEAAYAIDRMRRVVPERPEMGPFDQFVDRLAKKAGTSLEKVLSILGLTEIGPVEGKTAQPFARLARLLGLPLDFARNGILMAYQAWKDPEAAAALGRRFRDGQDASAAATFREWEDQSSQEIRGEMQWMRRAIETEYDQMG